MLDSPTQPRATDPPRRVGAAPQQALPPPANPDLPPLSRSDLFWLAAIAALAFLLRLIYLDQSRACPLWGLLIMDARSYGEWSDAIAAGDWLGTTIFYQAPLYPYFLAIVKLLVGHDLWNIRLVQIALGSLSCAILALAGRRFFASRAAGLTAGLMLALYPPAIFFDTLIQKANLGLVWTSLLLYILSRLTRRPTILSAAALGATLALLALTREETMLLAPVLLAWLLLRATDVSAADTSVRLPLARRATLAAIFLASLSLLLLPVAIRNHHVGGEFVLTTSQAGPNFYIGNNPKADGLYAPLRPGRSNTPWERQDAIELAQADTGHAMSPGEVSRYWTGKAIAYIRANPGAWLKLEARKGAMLVNSYEIPDAEDQYFFERYSGLLRALSRPWNLGVLLPIAVAGMVLAWRRREARVLSLVAATLAVGVILFYVFARYRYPLVPVIILFAGAAPWHGLSSPWRSRRTALALGAAALAAVASNWPLFTRDFQLAAAFSNAGAAISESGHPDQALQLFDQSLRLNPGLASTRAERALALARLGRLPEAVAELRQAVAQQPGDARLEFHLGTALAESGLFDEAAGHLARAVALGPTDVDARINYGMLLLQFRKWAAATEQLRAAARLDPANTATAGSLAWLLATCPDPSVRDGKAALAIAADLARKAAAAADPDLLDILGAAQAEAGHFADAARTARAAIDAAARAGRNDLAPELKSRLDLYEAGKPFHQP